MRARLFCRVGELAGLDHEVTDETHIGRGSDNQLVLDSSGVSEHHARLRFDAEGGGWILEDLGSTNGTELDGLSVRRPQRLDRLHVITFAHDHSFIFQDLEAYGLASASAEGAGSAPRKTPEDPASEGAEAAARTGTLVGEVLPVPELDQGTGIHEEIVLPPPRFEAEPEAPSPSFALEVEREGQWHLFDLAPGRNVIGRSDADISIPNPDISRRHALLEVGPSEIVLEDLGSTNGTFYDGVRIQTSLPVEPEVEITFGGTRARLVSR